MESEQLTLQLKDGSTFTLSKKAAELSELLKGALSDYPNESQIPISEVEKKTLENNMIKSAYKTAVKNFETAVAAGEKEKATELFKTAVKKVDQACTKGVIKANTASPS